MCAMRTLFYRRGVLNIREIERMEDAMYERVPNEMGDRITLDSVRRGLFINIHI